MYISQKLLFSPSAATIEDSAFQAKQNSELARNVLDGATQLYPTVVDASAAKGNASDLEGYAIVLTAGGEGERLRLSLLERGVSQD